MSVARVDTSVPLPLQVKTRLHFTDFFLLSATSGVAFYEWSGNSAYDPDITSIGIQPFYYDRYASLYTKYVVLGSRIKLKYQVDTGTNQGVASTVYAYYNNSVPNTPAGLREAMAAPYS